MSDPGFLTEALQWFTEPGRWEGSTGIPARTLQHLVTSSVSVGVAMLIAIPLGLYIGHARRFEFAVVSVANFGRAVPSFGLLLLFVVLFGLQLDYPPSLRPAILFALILLAIPPILTNTYVGVQAVEADTLEAARGMGMSERQVLLGLEVPLASPLIVGGIRTAAVQVVATATLAAVPAGGGLGRFIVDGYAIRDFPQIFGGALLVAALAILTEASLAGLQRAVTPRAMSWRRVKELEQPGRPPDVVLTRE